jgi:hypothetical protein
MNVVPRSLADDLLTHAEGRHCVLRSTKALLFTNQYLMQIGAEAGVDKTFAYGSDVDIRKICKLIWYGQCREKTIKVKLQVRDIGGHLDTTRHFHNKTGTDRIEMVIADIRAHANIPSHPHSRYCIVICKYLPAALYAISTSPENVRSVNRLMAAIADFLLGNNPIVDRKTRSTILAMYACGNSPLTTCDPWHYILRQRCLDFRRCLVISPRIKHHLMDNLALYCSQSLPGTVPPTKAAFLSQCPTFKKALARPGGNRDPAARSLPCSNH